ncbi:MAG: hypothetical protein HYT80_04765 [Euryarchaeota archaeon]|nr:hypothetical protein [Euryarchaeota archaeon]
MTGVRAGIVVLAGILAVGALVPSVSAHHGDTDEHAEFASPLPLQLYHHYTLMETELKDYQAKYPDFMKYEVIGRSVLGLNLYGVTITNFKSQDPPMDARPRMYFDGSIHSNEQLGMEAAMDIMRWLLVDYSKDPLAKKGVDTRITYIVPMVNPDGNVRDSRRNVNDVDLNRNFPHGWGGPGSAAKGSKPLSEPETQAIAGWLAKVRPHYADSFHTGTMMLLHPYGNFTRESKVNSPDHDLFTSICREIQEEMNKANGRPVPCGQIYSTIYPASGTTADYIYVEFGTVSWTFEVDGEQNLWVHPGDEASLRARLGETWASVKHAYENVERYGALLEVLEIASRTRDGKVVGLDVKLKNNGMGASSNGVVELVLPDGKKGPSVTLGTPIQPGEIRTVRLPAKLDLAAGTDVMVEVDYNKTFYKGFAETQVVSLEAVKSGGAVVLRRAGGAEGGPLSVADEGDKAGVPALDAGILVAVLAAAALVLRRRS